MKQLPAEIAVGGTRTAGCDIEIMTHEKVPCIMKEQENMSISEKLNILADAAKYDVSCSSWPSRSAVHSSLRSREPAGSTDSLPD